MNMDQRQPVAASTTAGFAAATDVVSNDEVVKVLNDLLENCRDGEYGFATCAEEVEGNPQVEQLFRSRAAACKSAGEELVRLVSAYGGEPADGGTAQGAMHRGWVHVKGAVGADSALSMLEECERGEDAAVARYRKALKQELPADVRAVIQQQAEGAQRNHDQIRDLRNAARAAN
ncbi:PA2169 family four-helix-bundle protein [Variovorax dokdonensis]|uniref:PA2169 family four-helix-bundle protein n=1 Tax=Variovorax dokdonensis TaxID=344883 RepID=A0ABT7N969_9BURK|nr:PA2169 family four-helix-bundle protein [Variovorax dokdonensis]MDM0044472.1 PA2169 family four-helix-bundle protein [Variovorax dokdonensis]